MKNKIISLFIVIILSACNDAPVKNNLLGTWQIDSFINLRSSKEELKDGDVFTLDFRKDSVAITEKEDGYERYWSYTWSIKDDSIIVVDEGKLAIKELTAEKLIIEVDWFGHNRLSFHKQKKD